MENQIDKFIIEATLISPIEKIIKQLAGGEFRDCDVNWLNDKLYNFTELAAKTFHITGLMMPSGNDAPKYMNDFAIRYYSKYFTQLLAYFKSI